MFDADATGADGPAPMYRGKRTGFRGSSGERGRSIAADVWLATCPDVQAAIASNQLSHGMPTGPARAGRMRRMSGP